MEFSWGLLLICAGVVGTVISLICLIKSLQAVETTTHFDIEKIAMRYADNLNYSDTASDKKSVHPAQTSAHSENCNIAREHIVHQENEAILDEDTMYSGNTSVPNNEIENIAYQDDETMLDEDTMYSGNAGVPNNEIANIAYQGGETMLDEDIMYSGHTDVQDNEIANTAYQDDETMIDEDIMYSGHTGAQDCELEKTAYQDDETTLDENTIIEIGITN